MAAVDLGRVSATVGYALIAGDFSESSPNLPQRITALCEANTANQEDLDTSEYRATTLKGVGDRYGYGSPAYLIARILLPLIGSVPLYFIAQEEADAATAKVWEITPVGTATANAQHKVLIGGRSGLDGQFYSFVVNVGDSSADIAGKIEDTVNAVLGCPMSASSTEYEATLTSRWKGLTANDLKVSIDTGDNDAGITYTCTPGASGAGTPNIGTALTSMKTKWNTIIVNSYGTQTDICDALEAWNGIPDPTTPTGQYVGTVMKPAVALTGSVAEDPSAFTDARKNQVTIVLCPAPLSDGLPLEAAANVAAVLAGIQQNTPEKDIVWSYMPDMPAPLSIGAMSDYDNRDIIVKKGCSTVDLVAGVYQIIDLVTTYHPEGELNPTYRYVRDLCVAFNIRYGYLLNESTYVKAKVLGRDGETVNSNVEVITPSSWRAVLIDYYDELIARGLCVDRAFFKQYLTASISTSNSNRLDTFFRTKLSGIARVSATENVIGFNFGSNT